jgi:hypothetical protein
MAIAQLHIAVHRKYGMRFCFEETIRSASCKGGRFLTYPDLYFTQTIYHSYGVSANKLQ